MIVIRFKCLLHKAAALDNVVSAQLEHPEVTRAIGQIEESLRHHLQGKLATTMPGHRSRAGLKAAMAPLGDSVFER